jgi:hypothetical protein
MRLTAETAARRRVGVLTRIPAWIGRRQREMSNRVHAAGDEYARQHGWEITKSTGQFGLGARSYRDPRFNDRRWQLSRRSRHDHANGTAASTAIAVDGSKQTRTTVSVANAVRPTGADQE